MFMLVWVPLPVCQTTSGNSSSWLPGDHLVGGGDDRAGRCFSSSAPRSRLTSAAAFFTRASAWMSARHALAGDREVLEAALGLGAPEAVGGDLDRAEGVVLGAGSG